MNKFRLVNRIFYENRHAFTLIIYLIKPTFEKVYTHMKIKACMIFKGHEDLN